jgi:hypothetical protein
MLTVDNPDPPSPPDEAEPALTCCDDPTPGVHKSRFYCEACDTEWVPASWLDKAREMYMALALEHTSVDVAVLEKAFDDAIAAHARATLRSLTAEPEGV